MHTYSEELELEAPRTDNQLRVLIKRFNTQTGTSASTSIDTTDPSVRGFYVHGFLPLCRAEGVLQAGDEVLRVEGREVAGWSLKQLARVIGQAEGPVVRFTVKRSFTVQK